MRVRVWVLLLLAVAIAVPAASADLMEQAEDKFAENDGVRIHYAAAGDEDDPLIVFVHGFPDFWYSWRHQMEGLQDEFRVVAMDTRGYNKSDQPEEQSAYNMQHLVADVLAVIEAEGRDKATVVGHDWGGAIAWNTALMHPEKVDKLIIVNLPHPKGIARELANNPEQQANSAYARNFQKPDSHKSLSPQMLAGFVGKDEETRKRYVEAFENSSLNGMMSYYRENYPREPYEENVAQIPNAKMPVLQFHGLKDTALNSDGLNNTWEWIDADYTLVTIPDAGHWAHHEAHELVTETMRWWLKARSSQ